MMEKSMVKQTTGWFKHQITLDGADFDSVCRKLKQACSAHGFKIRKETAPENSLSLEAMYGSRLKAFFIDFIPFIGRNLPAGKRLFLEATVLNKDASVTITIGATPYMELLDSEEFLPVSQSIDEKATDEYFASLKLYRIVQNLFRSIGREVPPEFARLNFKPFAEDFLWRFLLYPLESFTSPKPVFIPVEKGPNWCWGAFVIPEVWFLWHEIWGVSIVVFLIESVAVKLIEPTGFGLCVVLAGFLAIRVFTGLSGNRIYYYRYGHWLKPSANTEQQQ
jgi:hypothetical protein